MPGVKNASFRYYKVGDSSFSNCPPTLAPLPLHRCHDVHSGKEPPVLLSVAACGGTKTRLSGKRPGITLIQHGLWVKLSVKRPEFMKDSFIILLWDLHFPSFFPPETVLCDDAMTSPPPVLKCPQLMLGLRAPCLSVVLTMVLLGHTPFVVMNDPVGNVSFKHLLPYLCPRGKTTPFGAHGQYIH